MQKYTEYPEPEVPVDIAWQNMKELLDNPLEASSLKKASNRNFNFSYFYYIAGIILFAVIYGVFSNKPRKKNSILHFTFQTTRQDTLQSGSLIYLDKTSRIAEEISNSGELVNLTGNAFLQVKANNNSRTSAQQFLIGKLNANFLSGNIYLSFDAAALTSIVFVQTGSALVIADGNKYFLSTGEGLKYNEKQKQVNKILSLDKNQFSYATRDFEFNNTPLAEVRGLLEKAYNTTIYIKNTDLNNCRITTAFNNKPLKEVLDIITHTLGINYWALPDTNKVIIDGYGCK